MLRGAVVLAYFSGLGWVRVAVDEPSDEPLRKGETQRIKPSVLNLRTSVDSHTDTKSNPLYLKSSLPGLTVTHGG